MGPSSSEKWQLPPDVNWTLEIGKHLGVSVRERSGHGLGVGYMWVPDQLCTY